MHATRASFRCIEEVPALLVMLLHDSGKLPSIPNEPRGGILGFRKPTTADMESVKWVAAWDGSRIDSSGFRKVSGLACYRDYYEHHSSSDVREICAIRGSKRAIVALTRWMRDTAEVNSRRLIGAIEWKDSGLSRMMQRLGGQPVKLVRWEYRNA